MKMAINELTSVMECETRHQALRFVLIVTHTRHELKSLLEYGTVGGSAPQPLPITVTNYASACMHHARDVYQYIADLVEFRLRERTKVFVNLSNESLEDLLTKLGKASRTRAGGLHLDSPRERRIWTRPLEEGVRASGVAWAYLRLLVVLDPQTVDETKLRFEPLHVVLFGI